VLTSYVVACPEGITRATVLEICAANAIEHREADLTLDDFYTADEMFCTGTMGELAGVTQLDGHTIGNGEIGPMTRRLSALFTARTAAEGVPVCDG
jgi:branched-chain amino acid aminotransferase